MRTRNALRIPLLLAALAAPAPAAAQTEAVLSDEHARTYWAYVDNPAVVRSQPSARARRLGRIRTTTYLESAEVVLVLEQADAEGRRWLRVRYPGLGQRTGWVPAHVLSEPALVRTSLVIDRRRRRLTLLRSGRPVFRAPVGVGARGSPTPRGRFYVRERLIPARRNGPYGVLAFGLSAYSPERTFWAGGGQVGLHGTNQPRLIPGAISNGCIRLRNRDVRRLDRLMRVGTPLLVR